MSEHIIENCTKEEIDRLEQSNLNWYPDDLMTSDVCICGTSNDAERALEIIGRKLNTRAKAYSTVDIH